MGEGQETRKAWGDLVQRLHRNNCVRLRNRMGFFLIFISYEILMKSTILGELFLFLNHIFKMLFTNGHYFTFTIFNTVGLRSEFNFRYAKYSVTIKLNRIFTYNKILQIDKWGSGRGCPEKLWVPHSCKCSRPGRSFEKHGLVKGVPARDREVGKRAPSKSLPTQTIL